MTPEAHALLRELTALNGGEAVFRPSSIGRTIACPGSIIAAARAPKEERSSPFAIEGSVAHKVGEEALTGVREPIEWLDRKVVLPDGSGWFVDEEMVDAVGFYVETVRSLAAPGWDIAVEVKGSLGAFDPSDPLLAQNRGTIDCRLVNLRERRLKIVDLKYGKGIMVPGDSPQLQNYGAIGFASLPVDGGWEEVETIVVQPRSKERVVGSDGVERDMRVKRATFTPADLLFGFLPKLIGAMEESLDPGARLFPGEHCRFCPAKGACPAVADKALNLARDAFAATPLFTASSPAAAIPERVIAVAPNYALTPAAASPGTVLLPSPLSMDPSDLATILDRRAIYDAFMEGVERRAAQFLQAGVAVPGYAMKARTGNRKWRDPAAAPAALVALGLRQQDIYVPPRLKSPHQIEELMRPANRSALAAGGPLTVREAGEPTLVKIEAIRATLPTGLGALKPPGA